MNYSYGESVLLIEDVSLSFTDDKGKKKLILRDINLDIKDVIGLDTTGQIVSLLGVSGIGKTQLMKMIAGLQFPTTGTIKVGFKQEAPQAGQVGMVLQSYPLFEHRTVISNLQLICSDKAKIDELMEYFEVLPHKKKYPFQLSGGQRQRVAIIQQILSSDKFILLDEPFSGLDPVATKKLSKNIRKLADFNSENTIIISSHILPPALEVSDTAIMLGYEYDNENNKIEGATIVKRHNLLELGLHYHPELRQDPLFINLVNQIDSEFK